MTTSRQLKGLDAIRDHSVQPQDLPAVQWLLIDGFPRTGLTVKEAAYVTRKSYDALLDAINAGQLEVLTGGNGYIIPVDQLAVIRSWAVRLDPTA